MKRAREFYPFELRIEIPAPDLAVATARALRAFRPRARAAALAALSYRGAYRGSFFRTLPALARSRRVRYAIAVRFEVRAASRADARRTAVATLRRPIRAILRPGTDFVGAHRRVGYALVEVVDSPKWTPGPGFRIKSRTARR